MKFRRKSKNDKSMVINITPLIDIVFILLLFFAVTTSFITTSSIEVDLPNAKGDSVQVEQKNINIAINPKGEIYINGSRVIDEDLSVQFEELKKSDPDAVVIIEGDEESMYGKVVFVIDTARAADFTKFAIATEEE